MPANIANAVNLYNTAVARAGKPGIDARTGEGEGNFSDLLRDVTQSAADSLRKGEAASIAAVTGKADLTSVVTAVTNAELTLQTVVAVRDRVVQAYQEIIRMPI